MRQLVWFYCTWMTVEVTDCCKPVEMWFFRIVLCWFQIRLRIYDWQRAIASGSIHQRLKPLHIKLKPQGTETGKSGSLFCNPAASREITRDAIGLSLFSLHRPADTRPTYGLTNSKTIFSDYVGTVHRPIGAELQIGLQRSRFLNDRRWWQASDLYYCIESIFLRLAILQTLIKWRLQKLIVWPVVL